MKLTIVLLVVAVSIVLSILAETYLHRNRLAEIAAAKPKKRRKRFVPDYTI